MGEKNYESDEGWDKEYFEQLLFVQDELNKLGYEIRNCVRKSSINDIQELISEVLDKLNYIKEKLEKDK